MEITVIPDLSKGLNLTHTVVRRAKNSLLLNNPLLETTKRAITQRLSRYWVRGLSF